MLRACLVFFSKTVQLYLILFWSYGIESRNFYYNFKKILISLKYLLKIQFQVPLLFPKCLIFTFHVCPPLTWAYTDLLRQHLCPVEADFKRTPGQMDQAASSKVSRDEVHRPPPRCCCCSKNPESKFLEPISFDEFVSGCKCMGHRGDLPCKERGGSLELQERKGFPRWWTRG